MYSIAIDGPSGVGKSSLAKKVAKNFGIIYVDTGALYRCIGLYCVQNGIDSTDPQEVENVLGKITIDLKYLNGEQRVYLNSIDVSDKIRETEVDAPTSNSSSVPAVREFLRDLQQNIAKENSVIMDGRDIGTVILPNADVKIFITADAKERAKRRYDQLIRHGIQADYDKTLKNIIIRDENDINRKISPLKAADDAIIIDTTDNTKEKTLEIVTSIIRSKLK